LFGNLVNELLPSYQNDDADAAEGNDVLANGTLRIPSDATKAAQGLAMPLFPEVDALLVLFKDSCKELIDLRQQVFLSALRPRLTGFTRIFHVLRLNLFT